MNLNKKLYEVKKLLTPREDRYIYVGFTDEEIEKLKTGELVLPSLDEIIENNIDDWIGFSIKIEEVI